MILKHCTKHKDDIGLDQQIYEVAIFVVVVKHRQVLFVCQRALKSSLQVRWV